MRGWVSKLLGLVTVLVAIGFVALAGVGGWLYWNRVELRGEQAARAELAPLAADQVPKVFAYDYQTSNAASPTPTRCSRPSTGGSSRTAPSWRPFHPRGRTLL